jgi:ribosomal protein S18 acetylase RimI-like enzyme
MSLEIIQITRSQLELAAKMLALAFNHDPLFRYLCDQDEQKRLKQISWFANLFLRYGYPLNHVYTTANPPKGVAVWFPPGHFPLNNLRLLELGFYELPSHLAAGQFEQFIALFDAIETYHKQDMPSPHWYLCMLGVHPDHQNQGIGGLLLQPVLQQADAKQLCCYLETCTERAIRFYEKHGFEVVRTNETLSDQPCFWTMKRFPT